MSLKPGYNLVTERVEDTDEELPALAFFRRLAGSENLSSRVTVTGLGELLYRADEDEREAVIREIRDIIREHAGFSGPRAVQFVFDGQLVSDDVFTVRLERDGGAVYLPVGDLFVDKPSTVGPDHAVATR